MIYYIGGVSYITYEANIKYPWLDYMTCFMADTAKWGCKWLDGAIISDCCMQSTDIPHSTLNTLRLRRNEQHFAGDIFKRIFFKENVWTSIKISQKFVPKGPINNIPASVHRMAWRCSGNKPLSQPMMVSLPTHISVTQPQWVKQLGRVLF